MENNPPQHSTDLANFASVADYLKGAAPFFETRSSIDWFIKRHHRELVESGALIPRGGRSGSLVECEKFSRAVVDILKRQALARSDSRAAG